MHFSTESGSWSINNRAPINRGAVACFVLPNQSILVAMSEEFSFFTLKLEHTHDVDFLDLVNGLNHLVVFKNLGQAESGAFIMLS